MSYRTVSYFGLVAALGMVTSVHAQPVEEGAKKIQRYALLIGVNDYAPPLGRLEFCHNDMTELRAHLEAAGFARDNITFMYDNVEQTRQRPTKANIEGELRLRLQLANPDDVVLVAFSGHGVEIDKKSYLCPLDAKLDAVNSLVSIEEVYSLLEKCSAGQKVLLVDACRNEPIVRGFKSGLLADDLSIQMQTPPRGLLVLASCEPGQFSAEDAKLQHGVFMHYIIEGLKGYADTDAVIGGNNNKRISVDELYFYAHEKTKRHVANSHGIVQRPSMKGEIVGRLDLAMVPDSTKLQELVSRQAEMPTKAAPETQIAVKPTKNVDHPLLQQGNSYFSQGDYAHAIAAFTAIIDDQSHPVELRREARKSRGACYVARCEKSDIHNALIDQQAAGLLGVNCSVRAATAELKMGYDVKGKVKQSQRLHITRAQGDWLWVESVDGNEKVQGYIIASALVTPPPAPPPAVAQPEPRVVEAQQPTYRGQQYYDDDEDDRPFQNSRNQGNRGNSRYPNGRPPSIWETPEWESPRQIREGRANGTLR